MMDISKKIPMGPVGIAVAFAAALWVVAFALPWGNFWAKIAVSAAFLGFWALLAGAGPKTWGRLDFRAVLLGLAYAAALYGIFYLGNRISEWLFPFAAGQVGGIYAKGQGTPAWMICLLLLFVTGPAEEIFWRGYLQRRLMERLGPGTGFALATACYAGVHLCSANFMLIGAAGVAGLFWGALYWKTRNLWPLILSHSIWSTVVFAVLPIR